MPSVLDLPIERQQAIAKYFNKTLEEWRADVQETLSMADEHLKKIENSPPFQFSSKEREQQVAERYDSEQRGWRVVAKF